MAAAIEQPLTGRQGTTFKVRITVLDSTGGAYDLSAVGATLDIRTQLGGQTVASWSTGGGQITNNASGESTVKVDDSVTATLPAGAFVYLWRLVDFDPDVGLSAGDVFDLADGSFTILSDI